jgi:BON domain-containing protein
MPRNRPEDDRQDDDDSSHGLLLLAAGAVAGIAAGMYLAHRFGGVSGLTARLRERFGGGATTESEDDEEEARPSAHGSYEDFDDEDADDEDDEGTFVSADEELEERVLEVFSNDPVLRERAVDIGAINPATIELTGHVYTEIESEHAVTIARGVPGVTTVVNRLSVRTDEQGEDAAADRYASGDPAATEAQWEDPIVGTGARRQGSLDDRGRHEDLGRHDDPKVPLETRWEDVDEELRDAP